MSYRPQLKRETCIANLAPIQLILGQMSLAHVAPIANAGEICADELSSIAQAFKTCADELPSYTQLKPRKHVQLMQLTQLTSELPSKRASSSCVELICPRCGKVCRRQAISVFFVTRVQILLFNFLTLKKQEEKHPHFHFIMHWDKTQGWLAGCT